MNIERLIDNKYQLTQDNRKSVSLKIMDVLHRYCLEKDIKYFLYYGSLLGAVRHKGFIPWDDDIDVGMLRADYEKFIADFNVSGYYISNYKNQKKLATPFSKLCDETVIGTTRSGKKLPYHIGIDIFPIDGFSENPQENKRFLKNQKLIVQKLYAPIRASNLIDTEDSTAKKILKMFVGICTKHLLNTVYLSKLIDERAKKFSNPYATQVGCLVGYFEYEKVEKSSSENYQELILSDFEDKKYYIPKGFDLILKSIYGNNYMQLPPESKRVNHPQELYFSSSVK